MASPEYGGGVPDPDQLRPRETDPVPYHRAARFPDEPTARHAYVAVQETVRSAPTECDLSVYRLLLEQISHVAVLGEPPPVDIDAVLTGILATGETVTLPRGVLLALAERRAHATRLGKWVEGHYHTDQQAQ